jgi:hypothetical protein
MILWAGYFPLLLISIAAFFAAVDRRFAVVRPDLMGGTLIVFRFS